VKAKIKEKQLGQAMLEFERDQVKALRRKALPCDKGEVAVIPSHMSDVAVVLLRELRRKGPSTAQYLGDRCSITSHRASSTLSSLLNQKLVRQVDRSSALHHGTYMAGRNDRQDAWVYQAANR